MKYTKEERLDIGRRIYEGEFTARTAGERFGVSATAARDYMRNYRDLHHLPGKVGHRGYQGVPAAVEPQTMEDIEAMSREELIDALVMARINEARLKKGYMVKGVGANKEYILLGKKSTK